MSGFSFLLNGFFNDMDSICNERPRVINISWDNLNKLGYTLACVHGYTSTIIFITQATVCFYTSQLSILTEPDLASFVVAY